MDFQHIAQILVDRQLRIKEKEVVHIRGGLHNLDFLEEIAVQVRKRGAFPMLAIRWESLTRRLINEIPDYCLELPPLHGAKIEDLIDCRIVLPSYPDDKIAESLDPHKTKLKSHAARIIKDASVRKGYRRIFIGYPTKELAKMYNIPFETYNTMFWEGVNADLDTIFNLCQKVRERLKGDAVRVISPEGEELRFSVKNRRINMDDGVMSDEDLEIGDITANLPFGEVYLAPVEETVEGVAVFPVVFHGGQRIEKLRLVYRNGRMVESSAETNHDLFLAAMETHSGDKDRLGELGIGVNHKLHSPTGNTIMDEKIYGSIHLALGDNRTYGGNNNSTCHWDMVMLSPTLVVDDRILLDKGTFV